MSLSSPIFISKGRDSISQRVLSPRAGYIRDKMTELNQLLRQNDPEDRLTRFKSRDTVQQLSDERERAMHQQQKNLDTIEMMSEEMKYLGKKLQNQQQKYMVQKATLKRLQNDLERVMDVNGSLESRLATIRQRLHQMIVRFRKDYVSQRSQLDELTLVQRYISHLEHDINEQRQRTEMELTRNGRLSKQLDTLIGKYKALEAQKHDVSQQLDLNLKQRQLEQIDVQRMKQNLHNNTNYEITKMKKICQSQLDRWKDKAERRKIKNKEMKTLLQETEKQLEKSNTTANQLADELEDSQTQIQLLNAQLTELKSMLGQAGTEMGNLQEQYGQLKNNLIDVERQLVRRNDEADQYRTNIKNLTIQLQAATHSSKALRQRYSQVQKKIQSADDQVTRYAKQLANTEDDMNNLKRQNKQLKQANQQLKRLIQRQEELLHRQKRQRQDLLNTVEGDSRKKQFLQRLNELQRLKDSPMKREAERDREHKLKVIGQLQSMVKTHKQIYQTRQDMPSV